MKTITKKWLLVLLTILSVACLACGLVACGKKGKGGSGDGGNNGDNKGKTLATPVISLDDANGVISWNPVTDATRYYIYLNSEVTDFTANTEYEIAVTAEGTYKYTVEAYTTDSSYTSKRSAKSNEVIYTISNSGGGTSGGSTSGGGTSGGTTHSHEYEYENLGSSGHLKSCKNSSDSDCDFTAGIEQHSYLDATATKCEYCDYVRDLGGDSGGDTPHVHYPVYTPNDDSTHIVSCGNIDPRCDYFSHPDTHKYDDNTDPSCNLCGYIRDLSDVAGVATIGVGSSHSDSGLVVPGTGLKVVFDSTVSAGNKYKLIISTSSAAFITDHIILTVKNGDTTVGTYSNGDDDIILNNINLADGLVITHNGSDALDVTLYLEEIIEGADYVLNLDDDPLDIFINKSNLKDVVYNVALGSTVTDGETYRLTVSASASGTGTYSITVGYYEKGVKKSIDVTIGSSKASYDVAIDKAEGLKVTVTSNRTINSIALTLATIVPDLGPGSTYENPIIESSVAGTHTSANLQEAYFRLPHINVGAKYEISFAAGVTVKLGDFTGSFTTSLKDGQILTEDDLVTYSDMYNYFLVSAPAGTLCSFKLTVYEEIIEPEEYVLSLTSYVTEVEIGTSSNKTEFKLEDLEIGKSYTITLDSINANFYVVIGGKTTKFTYANSVNSVDVKYNGEDSLSIYADETEPIFVSRVALGIAVNSDPLEADTVYSTVFRTGAFNNTLDQKIYLKGVGKGTYNITFTFTSNVYVVFVISPNKGSSGELGSQAAYKSATGKIIIDEGCEYLTVKFKQAQPGNQNLSVDIYLELSPDQNPVLGLNSSVEDLTIPYASDSVRLDLDQTIKNNANYTIRIKTADIGSSVYVYFTYNDEANYNPAGNFEYNDGLGCYEYKFTKSSSIDYILLKHLNLNNSFDIIGATVSIVETKFGIGDTLDSAGFGIGQISSKDFVIEIDPTIPDDTKLKLTVAPYDGKAPSTLSFVPRALRDGSKWVAASNEFVTYALTNGQYVIEFTKQPATVTEGRYEYSGDRIILKGLSNTYFNATLILEAVESSNPGGDSGEVETNEGISLRWTVTASLDGGGGTTVELKLMDAASSGTEVGSSLPAGDYTFRIKTSISFNYATAYITPAGSVKATVTQDGNPNTEITISVRKGCTSLTFYMEYSNRYNTSCKFDFWLLGEGAIADDGNGDNTGGSGNTGGGSSSGLTVGGSYTTTLTMGGVTYIDLISVPDGKYTLTFSFVGGKPDSVWINDTVNVAINKSSGTGSGTITLSGSQVELGIMNLWESSTMTVTLKAA